MAFKKQRRAKLVSTRARAYFWMCHKSKSVFLEVLKALPEREWESMKLESQSGLDPKMTDCRMLGHLLSLRGAHFSYLHNGHNRDQFVRII